MRYYNNNNKKLKVEVEWLWNFNLILPTLKLCIEQLNSNIKILFFFILISATNKKKAKKINWFLLPSQLSLPLKEYGKNSLEGNLLLPQHNLILFDKEKYLFCYFQKFSWIFKTWFIKSSLLSLLCCTRKTPDVKGREDIAWNR